MYIKKFFFLVLKVNHVKYFTQIIIFTANLFLKYKDKMARSQFGTK